MQLTPAPGRLQSCSLPYQDPAHWPAGQHQPQECLGPSPAHQWTNTSFVHPTPGSQSCRELAQSTSRLTLDPWPPAYKPPTPETGSAHQWASTSPGTPWFPTASICMAWPHAPVASSLLTRQGLATNWTGGQAHLLDHPHSQLTTQKDPHSSHRGHPWSIQLWWPEGSALLGHIGCLLHKATSPR